MSYCTSDICSHSQSRQVVQLCYFLYYSVLHKHTVILVNIWLAPYNPGTQWHTVHKVIHTLLFSRLDYCISLLTGISQKLLSYLQLVQKAAARHHITLVLASLHWLPVHFTIDFFYQLLLLSAHGFIFPIDLLFYSFTLWASLYFVLTLYIKKCIDFSLRTLAVCFVFINVQTILSSAI